MSAISLSNSAFSSRILTWVIGSWQRIVFVDKKNLIIFPFDTVVAAVIRNIFVNIFDFSCLVFCYLTRNRFSWDTEESGWLPPVLLLLLLLFVEQAERLKTATLRSNNFLYFIMIIITFQLKKIKTDLNSHYPLNELLANMNYQVFWPEKSEIWD